MRFESFKAMDIHLPNTLVPASREVNGPSELGCLNLQAPPALLFSFPRLVSSCYISPHIAECAFRQIPATRWLWGTVNEWCSSQASQFSPFYLWLPQTKVMQLSMAPSVLVVFFHSHLSDDQTVPFERGGHVNQYCNILLASYINVLRGSSPDLEMWRWAGEQICVLSVWVARQRLLMPHLVTYGYGATGLVPGARTSRRRSLRCQGEFLLKHKVLSDGALSSSIVILCCIPRLSVSLIENIYGNLLVWR